MNFLFETDADTQIFCEEIAREMVRRFNISAIEAVGRINKHWTGQALLGKNDVVFHETEEYWAQQIYFEPFPNWWTIPNPKPRAYP